MTPKTPGVAPSLTRDIREAWRSARDEARDAFDDWCSAPADGKRDAYCVYRAAADREDAAAAMLPANR